jgi:transcription initiation factor TFIIE subunit alpha
LRRHSRQETREGQTRAISKEYYYIDFHATIDAIKYRIYHLTTRVKDLYRPSSEKKDYHCPRCHSQWTQLEVLDKVSMKGEFLCHRCSGVLERDDVSAADVAGSERQSKLYAQLDSFLQLMPLIDAQEIPRNGFEEAFAKAIPIPRDNSINPLRKTAPVDPTRPSNAAVHGLAQTAQAPLEVSFTNSAEDTAAARAAEERKRELAAANALPIWHTASTVTGEKIAGKDTGKESSFLGKKEEVDEKKEEIVLNDELAAYYEQMAKEREKEALEDRGDDSSEDYEVDFEDVGIGASGVGTPSSTASGALNNSFAHSMNGNKVRLKKDDSDTGSSGQVTKANTPGTTGSPAKRVKIDEDEGVSLAKRVKLEEGSNGVEEAKREEDSDEDEVEFEDAL